MSMLHARQSAPVWQTKSVRARLAPMLTHLAHLDVIHGSFADALAERLRHSVDLLVFNPPYVPTTIEELDAAKARASLAGAWAGGQDGMSVTDLFLPSVSVRGPVFDVQLTL